MDKKPHFTALVTFLAFESGKRTTPVSSGFRAHIKFPFDNERFIGSQHFLDEELIFPGDSAMVAITLVDNENAVEKLYKGLDFEMYEGDDLIGQGTITQLGGIADDNY